MILHILRALFILLMAAVGASLVKDPGQPGGDFTWLAMALSLSMGVLIVALDILSPRRKLTVISGAFLGLLVGVFIAYALSYVVDLVVDQYIPSLSVEAARYLSDRAGPNRDITNGEVLTRFINTLLGICTCYLSISFILQTKDDFRFVIPYVEFRRQTRGAKPYLLDTSALIDGRIVDIASTGLLDHQIIIPRFVLTELQAIADSNDKLKRNRGRRGLEILAKLQNGGRGEVTIYETSPREDAENTEVDQKLVQLARELDGRIVTTDYNMAKVAQLRGVAVMNVNELGNALRPLVLPGERMKVRVIKPGEEAGQGIGYLDDGTMVVIEQGRGHLNEEVEFTVTSALQTAAGRMVFGRMGDVAPTGGRRWRSREREGEG